MLVCHLTHIKTLSNTKDKNALRLLSTFIYIILTKLIIFFLVWYSLFLIILSLSLSHGVYGRTLIILSTYSLNSFKLNINFIYSRGLLYIWTFAVSLCSASNKEMLTWLSSGTKYWEELILQDFTDSPNLKWVYENYFWKTKKHHKLVNCSVTEFPINSLCGNLAKPISLQYFWASFQISYRVLIQKIGLTLSVRVLVNLVKFFGTTQIGKNHICCYNYNFHIFYLNL